MGHTELKRGETKMNTNDYIKYLTQTVVQHFDRPKEERKKMKMEKKELKEPFLHRWFGMLPYMFMKKRK